MVLVDSDVLIWYMRGNSRAKKTIDGLGPFIISSVNYMEIVQGIRNKEEMKALRKFLAEKSIKITHITVEISQRALYYMEQFSLSHHLRMADAFIAATAFLNALTLLTGNTKHYHPIKEIQVKPFRP